MSEILNELERLTGRESKLRNTFDNDVEVTIFENGKIGASQMKELLLIAGFDLISNDFLCFYKVEIL